MFAQLYGFTPDDFRSCELRDYLDLTERAAAILPKRKREGLEDVPPLEVDGA